MEPYLVQILFANYAWYTVHYCKTMKEALCMQEEYEYTKGIPSRIFINSFAFNKTHLVW